MMVRGNLRRVRRMAGAPALAIACLAAAAAGANALAEGCSTGPYRRAELPTRSGGLHCVLFPSLVQESLRPEPARSGPSTGESRGLSEELPLATGSEDERDHRIAFRTGSGRRSFEHGQHERLSCRECHGSGERHRSITVQTRRDCDACHHDPRRATGCGDCHLRTELSATRAVERTLALTVWEGSRSRSLPFAHETHGRIACHECHSTPVTLTTDRDCAACHADHHRPEASCATCHVATADGVHRAESHLSCAGSGCHAPSVAPAPAHSSNLCLMCHAEQLDHEVGGGCASCHQIPGDLDGLGGSGVSPTARIEAGP
jgi:hypothetical protein